MGAANERDDRTADAGNQLDEVSAERVARNNATFRMANETDRGEGGRVEHGRSAPGAV